MRSIIISIVTFLTIALLQSPTVFAAETVKASLEFYHFYQEQDGPTCFTEVNPPSVDLIVEMEDTNITAAYFDKGMSKKEFEAAERQNIELERDINGLQWMRTLPISARLLSWIYNEVTGCPYSWSRIHSIDPSLVFEFDLTEIDSLTGKVHSNRVHFTGIGVFHRPYKADMLIGQSRMMGFVR